MLSWVFFIAGVIFFIYGVLCLGENLKLLLKEKIVIYLRSSTKNPIISTIFGTVLTLFNQSSTATSILAVALVSSGLLSFYNSLGIIFGANLGSAIVVNFIALGIADISPLFLIAGFILLLNKKTKSAGLSIFYTGMAFFGLFLISQGLESLKSNPILIDLLTYNNNIFFLILAGIIFTIITNSSAITISTSLILAQNGLLDLWPLMFIILGANIGTVSTTALVSLKSTKNGKRTALAHIIFNIGGVILISPFLILIYNFLNSLNLPLINKAALFHLFFNFFAAVIFLIFVKQLYNFIMKIIPGKDETIDLIPHYLNPLIISKPAIALFFVRKELIRQNKIAAKMITKSTDSIFNFNQKVLEEIEFLESAVDSLQSEILSFLDLILLKNKSLKKEQLKTLVNYAMLTNTIERVGDRAMNLAQIAGYKNSIEEEIPLNLSSKIKEINRDLIALNKSCIDSLNNSKTDLSLLAKIRLKINNLKSTYETDLSNRKYLQTYAITVSDYIINSERIVLNCENILNNLKN